MAISQSFAPGAPAQGDPTAILAQMAQAYGGTSAIPAVQKSAMLARAMEQMSGQGANIRTPGALGTNLLAEALLQYGKHRNDAKLLADIQSGQKAFFANQPTVPGLDGDTTDAGASPSPVAPSPDAGGPDATMIGTGASPAPTSNGDLAQVMADAAARPNVIGGLDPMKADPGGTLADALGTPVNITSGQRSVAHNAAVGGSPTSEHLFGPHQGAWDFQAPGMSNPDILAKLAHSGLPFDQLIDEGDHVHLGIGPQMRGQEMRATPGGYAQLGTAPFAQTQAPGGNQSTASAEQPSPSPRPLQLATGPDPSVPSPQSQGPVGASPYQVASNGPTPPPPQGASPFAGGPAQMIPPPPQGAPGPQQGSPFAPQPQSQVGSPMAITAQERAQYQQLMLAAQRSPPGSMAQRTYLGQAMQLRQKLAEQASAPLEITSSPPTQGGQIVQNDKAGRYRVVTPDGMTVAAKAQMVSDGHGGFVPVPSTQEHEIASPAPGVRTQQDITGHITDSGTPNAVQSGQIWNPQTQSYQPLSGLQPVIKGAFAPGTVTATKPGDVPQIIQAPAFSPKDIPGFIKDNTTGNTDFTTLSKMTREYGALVKAVQQPGGVSDAAFKEVWTNAMTGGVPRAWSSHMIDEAGGLIARAKQISGMITSGQTLPPQVRAQGMQIMRDMIASGQQTYLNDLRPQLSYMQQETGKDLTPTFGSAFGDLPAVPGLQDIPAGGGFGGGSGVGSPNAPTSPGNSSGHSNGVGGGPVGGRLTAEQAKALLYQAAAAGDPKAKAWVAAHGGR